MDTGFFDSGGHRPPLKVFRVVSGYCRNSQPMPELLEKSALYAEGSTGQSVRSTMASNPAKKKK